MDTPPFTAEMYESLANVIVRMFTLRQKYQQMTREMGQTIEAIQKDDRTLGGEKAQRFFDVAETMTAGGEDGEDFLKVLNVGFTSQTVAMKDFMNELDKMLEDLSFMMK